MRSSRHALLFHKAIEAAVSAIEIYNKPNFHYREETFSILMLNAWELLLKARILKENGNALRSIEVWEHKRNKNGSPSKWMAPKQNRAGYTMTIGLIAASNIVQNYNKHRIDHLCIENLSLLTEIRDNAVHFQNASKGLRKKVQEIGAASVRNFSHAVTSWFNYDLSDYNFALMPFAFETPQGIIQTAFADDNRTQTAKISKLLADAIKQNPFDASKPFNVGVTLEVRFVRKPDIEAIPVRISQNDPNATPVAIKEESALDRYIWSAADLRSQLRKRYSDFKENKKFFGIKKPLEKNIKFSHERRLNPKNPKSAKQLFYDPNIVAEFDKHYAKIIQ